MTKVIIELDVDDLSQICADLASELRDEMPNGQRIPADDFVATLDAWRKHSPQYVADTIARNKVAFARGFAVRVTPRADVEAWHADIEKSANLLSMLVRQLLRQEESHAQ